MPFALSATNYQEPDATAFMQTSVATATTIKAPIGQTLNFVRYHLRSGIDHMFLYFDDPEDPSISRLQSEGRVTCIPCDEAHWESQGVAPDASVQARQMRNATRAFQRARAAGFEWLVHVDADELLYAKNALLELFTESPAEADILVFPTKEAVPQDVHYEHPFQEISLFKYDPSSHLIQGSIFKSNVQRRVRRVSSVTWQYRRRLLRKMGFDHPTLLQSFLLGHTNGKAATRTSVPASNIGNHRPQVDMKRPLRVYTLSRGAVLHFDCMGYDHWREKWKSRIEGVANFDTGRFREDRKRLLTMFRTAAQTKNEKQLQNLYTQLYFIPLHERAVMGVLGMIEKIHLSKDLFQSEVY